MHLQQADVVQIILSTVIVAVAVTTCSCCGCGCYSLVAVYLGSKLSDGGRFVAWFTVSRGVNAQTLIQAMLTSCLSP